MRQINTPITIALSALAGSLFAIGLISSMMVDPNKVLAFLRVFHQWDPSLALVMGSAIAVAMPAFWYAKKRQTNGFGAINHDRIDLPTATNITPKLLIGSAIFGIGWGLLGFCPAPALVSAFAGYIEAIVFMVALIVGYRLFTLMEKRG